jgi:hypothetical protein
MNSEMVKSKMMVLNKREKINMTNIDVHVN